MNPKIIYNENIQKSLLIIFISFIVTSCTTTQFVSERERDGIYYDPAKDQVYVENTEKEEVKTPIVHLGGRYFNEDMDAPRSFEEEVYESDPISSIIEPTQANDYIQWGDYQGSEISIYNTSPFGFYSGYYPYSYSNFSLGISFGFGSLYRPYYPFSYYSSYYPYNYYGFNHPYFGYYNRFYAPYYPYYRYNRYRSPYYGYHKPYYKYAPNYSVAPVTRGKGMSKNVNHNVVNRSNRNYTSGNRIIRRSNHSSVESNNNYRKDSNLSIRKRSLREVKSASNNRQTQYHRNSIRNARSQSQPIYRRSTTTNGSRSSSWSRSPSNSRTNTSTRTYSGSTRSNTSSSSARRVRR